MTTGCPDEMAQPHPEYYRQYLLYGDPLRPLLAGQFRVGAGPEDAGA